VLLSAEGSVVLLIDMQERLMPAMQDGDLVVARAVRVAQAARMLGPTVAPLKPYLGAVLAKTRFSALDDPDFPALLPIGSTEIVVAGCEAHICVLQTVLGLLAEGHRVVVVADAIGSRDPADKALAIDRARQDGAEIVTSEMVLFEWLRDSRHPMFREVQRLLK
jgi:nicotinamidase-related amidase